MNIIDVWKKAKPLNKEIARNFGLSWERPLARYNTIFDLLHHLSEVDVLADDWEIVKNDGR